MGQQVDTVIYGDNIVLETGLTSCAVAITDGVVVGVAQSSESFEAKEFIDAGEHVVLPGVVDQHVHLWEPGDRTDREDWHSGTSAAASGGVTTVIEMPMSDPPTVDEASFELKKQLAKDKAVVDYAIWGGVVGSAPTKIQELKSLGSTGYKAFVTWVGDSYASLSDSQLLETMGEVAAVDGFLCIHCENTSIVEEATKKLVDAGVFTGSSHSDARPEIAELEAISKVILLAKETGCRVLIAHLSTPKAKSMIANARAEGVKIYVETCGHYLCHTTDILEKHFGFAKCAPPIRNEEARSGLWQMLKDGEIDCVSSDHCPFTEEDKEAFGDNIHAIPNGVPGLDTLLHILVSEGVNKQNLSWEKLAEVAATNPAKLAGIYPQKGAICLGADADFVFVDKEHTWRYDYKKSQLKYKTPKSMYEKFEFHGKAVKTMVRGITVYEKGAVRVDAGFGRFVCP